MIPFYYTAWDIPILFAFLLSLWASYRVRSTFFRFTEVPNAYGMTGADAARKMLDANELQHIPIEPVPGALTDHYDPIHRAVRLSEPVYYGRSISAVSVACHEVGHAIQHKVSYPMLVTRHKIFPLVNIASGAAPFLILIGFLLGVSTFLGSNFAVLGIVFFSVAVLFQIITLPVEFDASNRARRIMLANGYIREEESSGVAQVLNAAALTYVAAALISLLQLLKFVMIFLNGRGND